VTAARVALAVWAAAILLSGRAPAQPSVPGEVLIAWRSAPVQRQSAAAALQAQGFQRLRPAGAPDRPETWRIPRGLSVPAAIAQLRRDPAVRVAEPNLIRHLAEVIPDDPFFATRSWPLRNPGGPIPPDSPTPVTGEADADIDATDAWEVTTGSRDAVVALIDTGMNLTHPDLAANLWTNVGEIPGNGIDDDHNGYVDDAHGWDFADHDADPSSTGSHGTFVAGVVGMVGNNGIGATGVCWQVSLMPLRVFGGSATLDDLIAATDYAADNGADVINASYGDGGFSVLERESILRAAAAGVIFVAASGNNGFDCDRFPFYPACHEAPNLISVGASDPADHMPPFSNWGRNTIDLLAPGVPIFSTGPGPTPGGDQDGYSLWGGTSFSAPHASGAAALRRSAFPATPVREVVARLRAGVDHPAAIAEATSTSGRLNANGLWSVDTKPPGAVLDLLPLEIDTLGARFTFTAPGDDGPSGTPAFWDVRVSTEPLTEENWDDAPRAWDIPPPAPGGSPVELAIARMQFDTLRPSTTYHVGLRAVDEAGNRGPLSNPLSFTTRGERVLFFDDIETDSGAWVADPHWQRTDQTAAASGDFAYFDDASPEADLTLATPLDLTGAADAELSFLTQHQFEIIGLDPTTDTLRNGGAVEVSTDGAMWERALVLPNVSFPYHRIRVPLGRWAGQAAVRVRFRMFSDVPLSQGDGWWIDDVAVTVPEAPLRSTPDIIVESGGVADSPPLLGTYEEFVSGGRPWADAPKSTLPPLDALQARAHALGASGEARAVFRPWIPVDGLYEVALTWGASANAVGVTVAVEDADGLSEREVTQDSRVNADQWIPLGVYHFAAGTGGSVTLDESAVTGPADPGCPGAMVADAARWRLVSASSATVEAVGLQVF
jgi:subtilisin family serine protease